MMKILNLILLSVSLAMDAFSVSLCKGLKLKDNIFKNALVIALFFGVAQAAMPLLGWLCSYKLIQYVEKFDHYIAFAVLAFIGIKMIVDTILFFASFRIQHQWVFNSAEKKKNKE